MYSLPKERSTFGLFFLPAKILKASLPTRLTLLLNYLREVILLVAEYFFVMVLAFILGEELLSIGSAEFSRLFTAGKNTVRLSG